VDFNAECWIEVSIHPEGAATRQIAQGFSFFIRSSSKIGVGAQNLRCTGHFSFSPTQHKLQNFRHNAGHPTRSNFRHNTAPQTQNLAQKLHCFPQTHTLITLTSSIPTLYIIPSLPLAEDQAGNAWDLSKQ
jgi:hypothetical protein